MKFIVTLLTVVFSMGAFASDPVYPVKNIRYISEFDYRTEVSDSDKYVVMVFSNDSCLERTIIDRSCWLFEKKLDYFVPKFSSKVKVIGFNTYFDNYRVAGDFNIKKDPTVVIINKGQIIKRFEPVYNPQTVPGTINLGWQDQLLKEVLAVVSQIH
jgi:thioredoxin-related protein